MVVAIDDQRPVMEPTLERSLLVAFGLAQPTPIGGSVDVVDDPAPIPPEPTPTPRPVVDGEAPDLTRIIEEIERLLEELRELRDASS